MFRARTETPVSPWWRSKRLLLWGGIGLGVLGTAAIIWVATRDEDAVPTGTLGTWRIGEGAP